MVNDILELLGLQEACGQVEMGSHEELGSCGLLLLSVVDLVLEEVSDLTVSSGRQLIFAFLSKLRLELETG